MRTFSSALLLIAVGLTACNSADTPKNPVGTYVLVSINEQALAYTNEEQGGSQILSGTLVVNPDGTFEASMTYSNLPGKPNVEEFRGTYSTDQNGLYFVWEGLWEGGGITPVSVEGNKLTINYLGSNFTYQR